MAVPATSATSASAPLSSRIHTTTRNACAPSTFSRWATASVLCVATVAAGIALMLLEYHGTIPDLAPVSPSSGVYPDVLLPGAAMTIGGILAVIPSINRTTSAKWEGR